jgi:hypothetical protein
MDYAQDGDLARFDPLDIAIAADWAGDPEPLWDALRSSGFVDDDGRLHDWHDYAGRLIERREKDKERQRAARAAPDRGMSDGCPADGARNPTVPNRTPPGETAPGALRAPSGRAPESRRTPIPPDWQPDTALLTWCDSEGFGAAEVAHEVEIFRNHYLGTGRVRADWSPAFKKWMLNAVREWQQGLTSGASGRQRAPAEPPPPPAPAPAPDHRRRDVGWP